MMSPSPQPQHNIAVFELGQQIATQLPKHLRLVPETDVDLGLVPSGMPGFSRRPDLLVVEPCRPANHACRPLNHASRPSHHASSPTREGAPTASP
jgi:hypothetical protein